MYKCPLLTYYSALHMRELWLEGCLELHSCFISYKPFALVSWGHTLEMSHITIAGVCEWLLTSSSNFNQKTPSRSQNYNLYLTKAAPVDRVLATSVKVSDHELLQIQLRKGTKQKYVLLLQCIFNICLCQSLKACCVEALTAYEATARARKSRSVLQPAKGEMEKEEVKHSENPSSISSESDTLNPSHTHPLYNSEGKDSLSIDPHGHVTLPLHTAVHSEEHGGGAVETDAKTTATQMRRVKEPHGNTRGEETVVKMMHDSQTDVKSHKKSSTVSVRKQRIKTDVAELSAGGGCAVPGRCRPPDAATPVLGGPLRERKMTVQRTNEAVWAAAALGFLLVLLMLSVLHTRLYRNCRAPSSLYWRESQQDYESVAGMSLQIKFSCTFSIYSIFAG